MKYSFLFMILAFFNFPSSAQDWRGALTNKELKGNVKTVISRYVTYSNMSDGRLAPIQTYRYNGKGRLVEKSFDFPGDAAHMSMKWIYSHNRAGQLTKSQVFYTRDVEGNERLLPEPPEYYQYNAEGKEIARLTINAKGDTTFRMLKEYDAQGFVAREITDGFGTHIEYTRTNDKNGKALETISSEGRKFSYLYDDDSHIIEQRWHDGVTERVYQRQTSKYENGRLVEKITYQGDLPETEATVSYDNFDTAGNYTKETWYTNGKLAMMFEYTFTYY